MSVPTRRFRSSWRGFADWNIGLTYSLGFVDAELRYAQAANAACGGHCDTHIIFSLIKTF